MSTLQVNEDIIDLSEGSEYEVSDDYQASLATSTDASAVCSKTKGAADKKLLQSNEHLEIMNGLQENAAACSAAKSTERKTLTDGFISDISSEPFIDSEPDSLESCEGDGKTRKKFSFKGHNLTANSAATKLITKKHNDDNAVEGEEMCDDVNREISENRNEEQEKTTDYEESVTSDGALENSDQEVEDASEDETKMPEKTDAVSQTNDDYEIEYSHDGVEPMTEEADALDDIDDASQRNRGEEQEELDPVLEGAKTQDVPDNLSQQNAEEKTDGTLDAAEISGKDEEKMNLENELPSKAIGSGNDRENSDLELGKCVDDDPEEKIPISVTPVQRKRKKREKSDLDDNTPSEAVEIENVNTCSMKTEQELEKNVLNDDPEEKKTIGVAPVRRKRKKRQRKTDLDNDNLSEAMVIGGDNSINTESEMEKDVGLVDDLEEKQPVSVVPVQEKREKRQRKTDLDNDNPSEAVEIGNDKGVKSELEKEKIEPAQVLDDDPEKKQPLSIVPVQKKRKKRQKGKSKKDLTLPILEIGELLEKSKISVESNETDNLLMEKEIEQEKSSNPNHQNNADTAATEGQDSDDDIPLLNIINKKEAGKKQVLNQIPPLPNGDLDSDDKEDFDGGFSRKHSSCSTVPGCFVSLTRLTDEECREANIASIGFTIWHPAVRQCYVRLQHLTQVCNAMVQSKCFVRLRRLPGHLIPRFEELASFENDVDVHLDPVVRTVGMKDKSNHKRHSLRMKRQKARRYM